MIKNVDDDSRGQIIGSLIKIGGRSCWCYIHLIPIPLLLRNLKGQTINGNYLMIIYFLISALNIQRITKSISMIYQWKYDLLSMNNSIHLIFNLPTFQFHYIFLLQLHFEKIITFSKYSLDCIKFEIIWIILKLYFENYTVLFFFFVAFT